MTSNQTKAGQALALVVGWVLLVLAVLAVGWLLTHPLQGSVGGWDDDVERSLASQRTGDLDRLAAAGTFLGNTLFGLTLAAVLAAAASVWRRSWRPAVFVLVLVVGAFALYVVATQLISRDRPPVKILDTGLVPDHSYPSGHTITSVVVYVGAAVLLGTFAPRARRWLAVLAVVPFIVAAARLYQGAHHPTDVLAGLLAAVTWLTVVSRVLLSNRGHREAPDGATAATAAT